VCGQRLGEGPDDAHDLRLTVDDAASEERRSLVSRGLRGHRRSPAQRRSFGLVPACSGHCAPFRRQPFNGTAPRVRPSAAVIGMRQPPHRQMIREEIVCVFLPCPAVDWKATWEFLSGETEMGCAGRQPMDSMKTGPERNGSADSASAEKEGEYGEVRRAERGMQLRDVIQLLGRIYV